MCSDQTQSNGHERLIQLDTLSRFALAVFGTLVLLYLLPVVPRDWMYQIEYYWAEFALLSLVVALFFTAATRSTDTAGRSFWALMTAAFCCWWLASISGFLIRSESPWLHNFIKDVLLLGQGCIVVVAADLRPGLLKSSTQNLQARMTAISSVAVIVGVFCYVALVPALAGIRDYESPFAVYAFLDAYIALRFVVQGFRTSSPTWRSLLLLIGTAFALISLADLLVVAFDSNTLEYRPGQALNLIWFLHYIALFFASRVITGAPQAAARTATANLAESMNPIPMMTFGVALPLIHLSGYGLNIFADSSRMARDLFVLAWLLGAAAILVWQYFLLRARLRAAEQAQIAARNEAAELQDQLRRGQRIELVGQLSGGLAHEFGNSLFGAESLAQKILRDVQRPGSSVDEENATGLVNALAGSRELIKKFKSLGRGDDTEASVVNVVEEVKSTLELLRSGISHEIALEFTAQNREIVAIARKQDLQQITLNLVLNARDAVGEYGSIDIHVSQDTVATMNCASCGARVSGNQVCLQVSDSGPGIDPKIRARLFEPLISSKAEGKGSGLGLSIVHSLVHQLQGHIVLDDAADERCTFTVMLPAIQLDLAGPTRKDAASRGRILLVETDQVITNIFGTDPPLQRLSANRVASLEASLIFLNQDKQRPELVIIGNLENPAEVVAVVEEAVARNVKVIMCSQRSQRAILAKLRGIDAFMDQPVNVDLFTSLVLKHLAITSAAH